MRSVLAGDLGGTKCRFALVTEDLALHGSRKVETVRERVPFLTAMEGAFDELLGTLPAGVEAPSAIGLGTAGVIPRGTTRIDYAPNVPLTGFDLGAHLRSRFGLPTALLNDGRASAWGENLHGPARGADPLLALFFGTGIGIGMVMGGRPFMGANDAAGEAGHTVFVPEGRTCPCGRRGCFEAYVGGRSLGERADESLGPRPGGWHPADLVAAAGGDPRAREIVDEARTAACVLVANLCTLLNPAAVVLGGGVVKSWSALAGEIERAVHERCSAPVLEGLRFHRTETGSEAILRGAAAAALQQVDPS